MGVLSRAPCVLAPSTALLVAAVGASGCVPTFDDDLPLVSEPIVLSVQAEPSEVAPGQEVRLNALLATPENELRAPELIWGLCTARKPLTELGPVNPLCIQAPGRAPEQIAPLGSGASVKARVPMDACGLFGPSLPPPMNGEPAGRPVDPDPTGGFYQPVSVTLSDTSVTSLGAVRLFCPPAGLDQQQGVEFNANYRRNQNPTFSELVARNEGGEIAAIPAEPEALRVAPGQALTLRASWASCPSTPECGDGVCGAREDKNNCAADCSVPRGCTGAESYAWFDPDLRRLQVRRESLRVSWFANGGRFESPVTGRDENETETDTENRWTAPSKPGTVRVWLVIRDARGGQSFQSFVLSVG